jgi:hypothetical protein
VCVASLAKDTIHSDSEDTRTLKATSKKGKRNTPEKRPEQDEHDDDSLVISEQIRSAHKDRSRERRKLSKKRERQMVKPSEQTVLDLKAGRVIKAEGAFFVVRLEDGEDVRAQTYKGTRTENPNSTLVTIGDEVKI